MRNGQCCLKTEDLDFFDPKKKALKGKPRIKILQDQNAPVRKHLRKAFNILVSPV
jgi:hypothetical protein